MHGTVIILLRLVHILSGVFWAGTIFFIATFLEPSLRAAGPAAAPIMLGLLRLRYFTILPMVAVAAILSGGALLWINSSGFDPAWMASPPGIGLSVGALFALVSLGVGLFVMRPAGLRVAALSMEAARLPGGPARDAVAASMGAHRARLKAGGRWAAGFLLVTVATMAVFRYLD